MTTEKKYSTDFSDLIFECHRIASEHGWWEDEHVSIPEKIALMHSELSEALEEYRNDKPPIYISRDKPEGIAVELADCVIRIMDLCAQMEWDLTGAMLMKMEFNESRPYRHGNLKA